MEQIDRSRVQVVIDEKLRPAINQHFGGEPSGEVVFFKNPDGDLLIRLNGFEDYTVPKGSWVERSWALMGPFIIAIKV